jgi:hypothetical protein
MKKNGNTLAPGIAPARQGRPSNYRVEEKNTRKKKTAQRDGQVERKKRPEATRTRPSCLKFLQIEDFKATIKNFEKQGKADFFKGRI